MILNLNEKQARFQSDDIPHRLGHTASNLARVRSFCNTAYKEAVKSLLNETQWFIEWTAAEIEPEQAEELVNIQVQLARWELILDNIWIDEKKRAEIANQAEAWSQRVLDMSGLLDSVRRILP
ncbi:MAG: hypothetical protein PUP93_00410 [Rhizonema sp. NSF051]|nr:hypothetical protein [Rhizonema sp. NSF051]